MQIRFFPLIFYFLITLTPFIISAVPLNFNFLNKKVKMELIISDIHLEDFTILHKNHYSSKEINSIFNDLKIKGDEYCSMRRRMIPYSRDSAEKFISAAVLDKYYGSGIGSIQDLVAGCWNFFEMNDFRPDLDFALVKKMYPDYEYDCYSVGFLQPYIMQNILSCKSLTMIDINWRILESHFTFITKFLLDRDAENSLKSMVFNWFALDQKLQKPRPGEVSVLCRDIQEKDCREFFSSFNDRLRLPGKIQLQLSPLYKIQYNKITRNTIRIFFLSNAVEEVYTSAAEFTELMRRTSDSLEAGQKALFIHHVGGWKLFGIYELEKTADDGSYVIKTICKDDYRSLIRSDNGIPVSYVTHFEKISRDIIHHRTCNSLVLSF